MTDSLKEIPTEYKTVFDSNFEIQYKNLLPKTGDNVGVNFIVLKDKELFTDVIIRISGTLISLWQLGTNIENDLVVLGSIKIRELLEDEVLNVKSFEFIFTTQNTSSQTLKNEIKNISDNLENIIALHRQWKSKIQDSFSKNQDLIINITKEQSNFQEDNSRELRNTLLQLVILSAGIVVGVITLGRGDLKNNTLTLVGLTILIGIVFFGLRHIFSVLEDRIIATYETYKDISDRLELVKKAEFSFLQKPNKEKYNKIFSTWEKHVKEIENKNNEIPIVRKDKVIMILLYLFGIALILITVSFIDFQPFLQKQETKSFQKKLIISPTAKHDKMATSSAGLNK